MSEKDEIARLRSIMAAPADEIEAITAAGMLPVKEDEE